MITFKEILLNLAPLWLIRRQVRLKPPTASFRTSSGRTFRLLKVSDDFCVAISSEVYDPEITQKLMEMHHEGERMQQAAIKGLNNLTMLERERLFHKERDLDTVIELGEEILGNGEQ